MYILFINQDLAKELENEEVSNNYRSGSRNYISIICEMISTIFVDVAMCWCRPKNDKKDYVNTVRFTEFITLVASPDRIGVENFVSMRQERKKN